jgi:hypothetical protein
MVRVPFVLIIPRRRFWNMPDEARQHAAHGAVHVLHLQAEQPGRRIFFDPASTPAVDLDAVIDRARGKRR